VLAGDEFAAARASESGSGNQPVPIKESHVAALTPADELAAKNPTRHPNESDEYRRARQVLLIEEIELRRQVERVASLRRDLPSGGEVPQDYHFVAEDGTEVTLSDLFGEHETLIIYSYMFGPQREAPCPMCTSMMGGLDHKITDIRQRAGIAFTARSPIERLLEAKQARGWTDVPVFSDQAGDYTRDYVSAEDADVPAYNVFTRRDGVVRHFWSDEISGDMADPDQDPRGAVEMDSLWLLLDTVPEGRGTDWRPQLTY
jgi:predicted dithiol-disulfide oxidoreductase (DUF899 family)